MALLLPTTKWMRNLAASLLLGLAACDGRPLLYQVMPSAEDIGCINAFQMIDVQNKGQLTRAEVEAYFARRFRELDRNRDGFLDADEAQLITPIFRFKSGQDLIFHIDINGDGKLSADEFARLTEFLFTRDANRDGILTLAEVKMPPPDTAMRSDAKLNAQNAADSMDRRR
jgi:EF-hand domain pair